MIRNFNSIRQAFLILTVFVSVLGFAHPAVAQNDPPPPPEKVHLPPLSPAADLDISEDINLNSILAEDTESLILGATINGISRNEGLSAFLPKGAQKEDLLLPLGEICKALSFAIKTDVAKGHATGWFMNEQNTFDLNLKTGQVFVLGKMVTDLAGGDTQTQAEDIYVRVSLLEKWFGVKTTLNLNDLEINITTDKDLPFQERLKRLENAERFQKTYTFDAVKPENATLIPYKMLSLPAMYLTNSLSHTRSPGTTTVVNNTTLQSNFDFLKFETDSIFNVRTTRGEDPKITTSSLIFEKRSQRRGLLGPLKAGKIGIGDVSYPSTPLFLGGQRGAGFSASSDPRLGFRYAGDPDTFVIDGDAPVGWDAELYRNGNFVSFQRIPETGRFLFDNLELLSGYNIFQVILYGPEGQKLRITREVFRGAYMLKEGQVEYDFAAGQPNADFLPLPEDSRQDRTPGASGQVFYGISNNLTVGANFYTGNELGEDTRDSAVAGSVSTSLFGANFNARYLLANEARRAYELSADIQPFGYRTSVSHSRYSGFDIEDEDILTRTEFQVYKGYQGLNLGFGAEKLTYQDKEDTFEISNTLSTDLLNVKFTNDVSRIFSKDNGLEEFKGELTGLTDLYDFRWRASLNYDLETNADRVAQDFSVSGQRYIDSRTTLRLGASRSFASGTDTVDAQYSKDFQAFGVDFGVSANTEDNYTFTLGLRASLQADERNMYNFEDPKTGGLASIGGRAFIDENGNDLYDPKEELIENVKITASSNGAVESTNKAGGVTWMKGLGETPTRISLVQESIPTIYTTPNYEFKDIIPRKGINFIIDFPFSRLGEIEGTLTYNSKPVESVPVRLSFIDKDGKEKLIDSALSEYDGYYIFSALKAGTYRVYYSPVEFELTETALDKLAFYKEITLNPNKTDVLSMNESLSKAFYDRFKKAQAEGAIAKPSSRKPTPPDIDAIDGAPSVEQKNLEQLDLDDVIEIIEPEVKKQESKKQ